MPTKKATKKTTKTAAKKAPAKVAPKKKTAKEKVGVAYECHVCGVRMIVDEFCGCVEEHTFVCCNKVMKKKAKKAK